MAPKLNSNEMPDLEDNLLHFKGIKCKVNFTKPHERRFIIKNANQMYKLGFERFLLYISPHLQEREALKSKIQIARTELKFLEDKSEFYKNDEFYKLYYEYRDYLKLEKKNEEIPKNDTYYKFLKFKEDFKELLIWHDKATEKDKEYDNLHNLLRKSEEELKKLGHYCFRIYNLISPPLSPFLTSFHDIHNLLIEEQKNIISFELYANDDLPRKTTQWNTDKKLFAFLIARKKYWFECWRFLEKNGLSKKIHPHCKWALTKKQTGLLLNSLLQEGFIQILDIAFVHVVYNVVITYNGNEYQRYPSFKWLKSVRELAYLFSQLIANGFADGNQYPELLISNKYVVDINDRRIYLKTYKIYVREFKIEDFAPPKNAEKLDKLIKKLKNEK